MGVHFNFGAILPQTLGIVCLISSAFVSTWLSNPPGLNGYLWPRYWGLLTVMGERVVPHGEVWTKACRIQSRFTYLGSCASGICSWYQAKCQAYRIVMLASHTLFGVVLLVTAIQVCGIICSFRRTLKTLMFASVWIIDWYNAVALISHILPLCLLRVMYFNSTTAGFHNYQRCGILSDSTTRICLCHVLPRTGVLFYRRNCPLCQIFQDKEWGDARGRSVGQLSASQAPIRSLIFHKSSHTFRILYETMATPINI